MAKDSCSSTTNKFNCCIGSVEASPSVSDTTNDNNREREREGKENADLSNVLHAFESNNSSAQEMLPSQFQHVKFQFITSSERKAPVDELMMTKSKGSTQAGGQRKEGRGGGRRNNFEGENSRCASFSYF